VVEAVEVEAVEGAGAVEGDAKMVSKEDTRERNHQQKANLYLT
jgi:hypothetical protein